MTTAEAAKIEAVDAHPLVSWRITLASSVVLAVITSLFVLHPFTPTFPMAGLDGSWEAVLGDFAAKHARWGVDLIFTYGPAFPITQSYFNLQYFQLTIPILLTISVVNGFCVSCLFGAYLGRFSFIIYVAALLVYIVALIVQRQNVAWQLSDSFFFSLPFTIVLLDLIRPAHDRLLLLSVCLGAAVVGITMLSKMTFGLAALPLFLLADVRTALARRLPPLVLILLSAFVVADLAYGQSLRDLATSLRLQAEVIGGYSNAMALSGSLLELGLFFLAAAALLITVAWVEIRPSASKITVVVVIAATATLLFVVFKAGFVRHDVHTLIAWTSLGVIGLLLGLTRLALYSPRLAVSVSACSLAVLVIVCPAIAAGLDGSEPSLRGIAAVWRSWFLEGPPQELSAAVRAATNPSGFVRDQDEQSVSAWSDISATDPMPHLDGTVDIIPSHQSALLAEGLDFHPRPSFQQYATYTAGLVAANRAFYLSSAAPEWVLFAPESVDGRYPAFSEGALWPLLIERYEPAVGSGSMAVLHRRPAPLQIEGLPRVETTTFGRFVSIPDGGPVFARIEVRPNFVGRLIGFLFHAPTLVMTVRLDNSEERHYRYVPALGQAGFLISPLITQASEFVTLFGKSDPSGIRKVVAVRLDATEQALWAYGHDITIESTPLLIPVSP